MKFLSKVNKDILQKKLSDYSENYYLDIQGFDPISITESQIAKLLTKVAVGSVTAIWSIIELKNLVAKLRNSTKG